MVCDQEIVKSFLASNETNTDDDETLYQSLVLRVTKKSSNQEVHLLVFVCLIILSILLTNSLMIIGLWKTNKKLTIIHKLLIYTSITDLMVGFFTLPYFVALRLSNKVSCFNDMIGISVGVIVSQESQQTILTLSIMRYLSIHSPLKRIRDSTIIKVMITQMFISIGMGVQYFYVYYVINDNNNIALHTIEWFIFGLFTITCTFAAVICNLLSRAVLTNKRAIQQSDQHLERHRKAVKRLLLICICNILCYTPASFYQLYGGIVSIIDSSFNLMDIALITLNLNMLFPVMLLSPVLNSLVYIVWDKRILVYYKRVLNTRLQRLATF